MKKFGHRDIFWRGWVFQEAALARSGVFFCDNVAVEGRSLFQSASTLKANLKLIARPPCVPVETMMSLRQFSVDLASIHDIYKTRTIVCDPTSKPSLLFCLWRSILTKVMDLRDKIYAVLGLCQVALPISYEDSVAATYLEAAKHMILRENTLDCLLLAGTDNPPGTDRMGTLPSWVPDLYAFTKSSGTISLSTRGMKAKSLPKFMRFIPCISEDGKIFVCDAIPLPTGKLVCSVILKEVGDGSPARLKRFIQQIKDCQPSQPSGLPHLQAFLWLLLNHYGNLNIAREGPIDDPRASIDNKDWVFDAGLQFCSWFWAKRSSHETYLSQESPGDGDYASNFIHEFEMDFLGYHDSTRWPPLDGLQDMLRLDPDKPITFNLRRSLQNYRDEYIFGTQNGLLGCCSFLLVPEDVFFYIPGCSRPLVMRKVSGHYVLRGSCIIWGYQKVQAYTAFEDGILGVEKVELR